MRIHDDEDQRLTDAYRAICAACGEAVDGRTHRATYRRADGAIDHCTALVPLIPCWCGTNHLPVD